MLYVLRAIVRVMGHEELNVGTEPTPEAHHERLAEQYRTAIHRYEELRQALPETEAILYRGLPPANDDERHVATAQLQQEALEGVCEEYAQKGEYYAERAMRMLEQLKAAETTIRCLYFDAKRESNDLAELIRTEHPWVEYEAGAANDDTYEIEKAA